MGLDHGVGHPSNSYPKGEAPNSLRTWEFGDYAHYSEWPKVADVVIEAKNDHNKREII